MARRIEHSVFSFFQMGGIRCAKQGHAMMDISNGNRWALIPEDCSARVEGLAKRHLLGR